MKGYKVFNSDWQCRGKQYSCPGTFEENVKPELCKSGMHFCKRAIDCFSYYIFTPENHVAEIEAYGEIVETNNKCCSNKIKIIREVSWSELLELVNIGINCTGIGNAGDKNSGDHNVGFSNSGDRNTGDRNSGYWNSGDYNFGGHNTGDRNFGSCNVGDWNSGRQNVGNWNSGNNNTGNHNTGDWNAGDWNITNFSSGCFNTQDQYIYFFNKPSCLTLFDWHLSSARRILEEMPFSQFKYILFCDMTDDEKILHPEASITGGFLRFVVATNAERQNWWDSLSKREQQKVVSIPNFDPAIFKKITGITV